MLAFDIETPADGAKRGQGVLEGFDGDASSLRDDDRRQGVQDVVATRSGQGKLAKRLSGTGDGELHVIARESRFARNPVVFRRKTVGDYRTKGFRGSLTKRRPGVLAVAPDNHPAVPRHQIHQALEGQLIDVEVGVDIGMVEFDVVDDRDVGQVLQELGRLVEVGAVVLIAFDDEVPALPHTVARSVFAEIQRHAADEHARVDAAVREHPPRR